MPTAIRSDAQASGYQLKGGGPSLYEQYWVPAIMGLCAADLTESACLREGEKVLDVACGTGVVARTVAKFFGGDQASIAGIDINDIMLDTARRQADMEGIDNIDWQIGDASQLPFKASSFEVALCQQGLQFMPDPTHLQVGFFTCTDPTSKTA